VDKNRWLLSLLTIAPFALQTSLAAEGGSSNYLQGTYGEFATGMLGPQGIYVRNEALYYDADVEFRSLGRHVDGHISQAVWGDLLKIAYISDTTIFGGRFNAGVAIPAIVGSSATINIAGLPSRSAADDDVSGLGDIYVTPAALGWNWDRHHLNASMNFIAPTGEYEDARVINPGRNYWSLDPTLNYTWLHSERGHEVTVVLGYTRNYENRDAAYTSGDEIHLDWTIAQHLSEKFAVGLTGYWYEQVTEDTGEIPAGFVADDFNASGLGVGAAVHYSTKIANHEVSLVAKWITDLEADKRLDGDFFMASFAFKL
jgi:hypothetical protein